MGLNIDFKMLPMKAHYFLYNAGMCLETRACDANLILIIANNLIRFRCSNL